MVHDFEVLKDDAEVAAQVRNRVCGEARDVAPAEENASLIDRLTTMHELNQRAFSRAAWAGDEDEFSSFDCEVDVLERRLIAVEELEDVLENEDRLVRRHALWREPRAEERERSR